MKTVFLVMVISIAVLGVNLIGILWLAARSSRLMDESVPEGSSDNSSSRRDAAVARTEDEAITLNC